MCTRFCLSLLRVSGGYGVWFKTWFCPSYNLSGASPLPLNMGYLFLVRSNIFLGFPCGSAGKESICKVGDMDLIPELKRPPGEGKGYPLQYSGMENSMDSSVHGVSKSRKWLSHFPFPFQHSPVDGRSAANCSFYFLKEKMSTCPPTPLSCFIFSRIISHLPSKMQTMATHRNILLHKTASLS